MKNWGVNSKNSMKMHLYAGFRLLIWQNNFCLENEFFRQIDIFSQLQFVSLYRVLCEIKLVFSFWFLKIWWLNIVCTSLSRVKYTLERSQFGPLYLADNIFGVTFILSNDLSEINSKQTDDNNQENEDLLIHDKKLRKLRNVTIL